MWDKKCLKTNIVNKKLSMAIDWIIPTLENDKNDDDVYICITSVHILTRSKALPTDINTLGDEFYIKNHIWLLPLLLYQIEHH